MKGAVKVHSGRSVERWRKGRTFTRSYEEDYKIFSDTEEKDRDGQVQTERMT
jgi:hypothetical protein